MGEQPDPIRDVHSERDAYLLLERLRWGERGAIACPRCGAVGRQYFLKPANGVSRATRTGSPSERRLWKCGRCRAQYSALTDTIFQASRISIRTWLMVILAGYSSAAGLTAPEIARRHRVTQESARHMIDRISRATAQANDVSTAAEQSDPTEFLRALVQLSPADAALVRAASPATRPRKPPEGPWHEYGEQ